MVPLAIVGRAVATGVGEGVGVGRGASGSSAGGTGSATAIFSVTEWPTLSFSFLATDSATPSLSSFSLMATVFF